MTYMNTTTANILGFQEVEIFEGGVPIIWKEMEPFISASTVP